MNDKTKPSGVSAHDGFHKMLIFNQHLNYNNDYKSDADSDTRQTWKIIKLFRCFGCNKCFTAKRMSGLLIICKSCLISERIEDERSRKRLIEKALGKIGVFLRRRV